MWLTIPNTYTSRAIALIPTLSTTSINECHQLIVNIKLFSLFLSFSFSFFTKMYLIRLSFHVIFSLSTLRFQLQVSSSCCWTIFLFPMTWFWKMSHFLLQVQHYILVVQAQDNGHPSLSSTLTVYCNVIDLNDNAPVFDPMSYSNEIYENVPIRTEVVRVSATDIDSGEFPCYFLYLYCNVMSFSVEINFHLNFATCR